MFKTIVSRFKALVLAIVLALSILSFTPSAAWADKAVSNLDVVQEYYDALARGDLKTVLGLVASDGVLEEPESLPYAGTYRGPEEWGSFGAAFNSVWKEPRIEIKSIADAGEYVVGLARLEATARDTNRHVELPLAELFWVEDGKITRLLPFYWDTAAVVRATQR